MRGIHCPKRLTFWNVQWLIAWAVLGCFAAASHGGDWPRFRGPEGDGTAAEADVPLRWSDAENVLWKTPLPGPGASSPIVAGGRLFVTAYSGYGLDRENPGDPAALERYAICVDPADGRVLWSHKVQQDLPDEPFEGQYLPLHGYASSTPVCDGQRVYFFFGKSGVAAFSLDGRKLWQRSVGSGVHAWGTGASPVVYGKLLIVNASIENDTVVALDKQTGETVWSTRGFPRAWNTPTLVDAGGQKPELVVNLQGSIRALDPDTGAELWRCQGIRAAELCPTVVVHDGVVYVIGSPRGEAFAVRAGGRGDVSDTHKLWQIAIGSNVSSPVYHEGHLYWANDSRGIVYCVRADNGEVVYQQRLAPRPGRIYASPVLVGDRLYYVSRDQGTYVLAARPRFELLAHNVLAQDPGPFNGSPAVCDGRLYLRSDRFLYCIGEPR